MNRVVFVYGTLKTGQINHSLIADDVIGVRPARVVQPHPNYVAEIMEGAAPLSKPYQKKLHVHIRKLHVKGFLLSRARETGSNILTDLRMKDIAQGAGVSLATARKAIQLLVICAWCRLVFYVSWVSWHKCLPYGT